MTASSHDAGLQFDVKTGFDRRRMMRLMVGGAGLLLVGACGDDSSSKSSAPTTRSATGATTTSGAASAVGSSSDCATIPSETAGPYPGDGSNGPDVLSDSGVVRRDITSSFGDASGKAAGIPLTINLALLDRSGGCKALAGAAVYLWHCDRAGKYSLYSQGVESVNYLRGVQEADANGRVTFTSIFPAAYSGRWPHIHFEVYPSLAKATSAANKIATSQLAIPKAACDAAYATSGYEESVRNLAQTSLQTDNVFGDDAAVHQLATMAGSVSAGFTAELSVPV